MTPIDFRSFLEASSPILECWDQKLSEVIDLDPSNLFKDLERPEVKERLRIYSLLIMALVSEFWNGNKFLESKAANRTQKAAAEDRGAAPYLGHNVACIAVDSDSRIITYDFHHHDFARSLVEHAEARIVRRLFDLNIPLYDWRNGKEIYKSDRERLLQDITIFTSLQSCPQCTGAMMWGRVAKTIYLQTDPGVFALTNLMCRFAGTDKDGGNKAPIPVYGSFIDLPHSQRLDEGYSKYIQSTPSQGGEFDVPHRLGHPFSRDPSITSYLCSPHARSQFSMGAKDFHALKLDYADRVYPGIEDSVSNEDCLNEARKFFEYVTFRGERTPPVAISNSVGL